jgi:hypothetical protein
LLEYIRTHWRKMLEWGATTWWETWEPKGSFCHGWSSGPNFILQAEILGVKPDSPGWNTIRIEPHPAGLAWARGSVPTPRGTVSVEWNAEKEFALQVSVPAPARVTVPTRHAGVVTVTKTERDLPAEVTRAVQGSMEVTVFLPEPGTYRLHSY